MRPNRTLAGNIARVSFALFISACAAKPPPAPPPEATAVPPAAMPAPVVEGFTGPIAPLAAPVAIAYRPAVFRGMTTIGVTTADRPGSSLSIHITGNLTAQPDGRLRATLVTEHVDVDGVPSENSVALLVQEIGLGKHGELMGMTSRTPAATGQLADRYVALEQGWRDRLPLLASTPVGADQAVEAEDRLLTALMMLGGRGAKLKPVTPLRTVAVGTTTCGTRTCLVGRRTGTARLTGRRGPIDVTISGHALLDLATGLFVEEKERIVLAASEGDGQRRELVMSVASDLQLR